MAGSVGIEPDRSFDAKFNVLRGKTPMAAGIVPVNWLLCKSNTVSCEDNSAGSVPDS